MRRTIESRHESPPSSSADATAAHGRAEEEGGGPERSQQAPGPKSDSDKADLAFVSFLVVVLLALALLTGFAGIAVYAFFFAPSGLAGLTAFLLSLACMIAGDLVGTLFGLPRSRDRVEEGGNERVGRYVANTNLEDVSDWLTKIIIGLSLVEFRKIADAVSQFTASVSTDLGGQHAETFVLTVIIYFSCTGFLVGYLWARVSFWQIVTLVERVYRGSS